MNEYWWWYSKWTPLFGLNLDGHLSSYPSVGSFRLQKPQKVPRSCPHTFHLIWLGLKLWCYLRFLRDIFLWLCCNLYLFWIGQVLGHLLGTVWGFQSPNGPIEGHVLRCPPRFSPKRGLHLLIIIIISPEIFWAFN